MGGERTLVVLLFMLRVCVTDLDVPSDKCALFALSRNFTCSILCGFVEQQAVKQIHSKSTTDRTNRVWALLS